MADLVARFRVATWLIHGVVVITLIVLLLQNRAIAGWCIFPGLLIACASVAASPGRPLTLYGAFGALMGLSFYLGVSSIYSGDYLGLVPVLLLIVGVSWFLREPAWPSFVFSVVAVSLALGLMALLYHNRFELSDENPEFTVRFVRTSVVMLVVGTVYLAVGFAEVTLVKTRRKKKRSTAIRTPSGPSSL